MKSSQIANAYLLELAAIALPQYPEIRSTLLPDVISAGKARGARDAIMGCLKYLGYEVCLMSKEAAQVARKAMRQPDPLAFALAAARANPLALTDEEAALRSWGLGVEEAKSLATTPEGIAAANAIGRGWYRKAERVLSVHSPRPKIQPLERLASEVAP